MSAPVMMRFMRQQSRASRGHPLRWQWCDRRCNNTHWNDACSTNATRPGAGSLNWRSRAASQRRRWRMPAGPWVIAMPPVRVAPRDRRTAEGCAGTAACGSRDASWSGSFRIDHGFQL